MLPRSTLTASKSDDPRLVANAGLILPVTLAGRLDLSQLVDNHVDLGDAPGRANTGDKILTLVASALAGGDCIDDTDVLRAGRTSSVLGCVVKAPSTLGTFLRSFRWGHVRQLDHVSRELLARAWDAGTGPEDSPLTIDIDSGLRRTGKGGSAPSQLHRPAGLSPAAGRCRRIDVLMARAQGPGQHRPGRSQLPAAVASAPRRCHGSAHGAGRPASMPTPSLPSVARWMSASPSPSDSTPDCAISSRPYQRRTGHPYPTGWTAPPMWPRPFTLPSTVNPTTHQCASSSAG